MKNNRRFFAAFLVALLLLSLSACTPNLVVSAVTPTPEATTETTATPTPTPSPEPTAVPTPAVDEYGFTEERKAELNQQMQDFLNYRGEFTQEKMSEMMMTTISPLDQNEVKLGFVDISLQIQGYFFDYFEKDDRIFMLMGFDGKDSNRFVTLVDIPLLYPFDEIGATMFSFEEYKVNHILGIDSKPSIDENGDAVYSPEGNINMVFCYNRGEIVDRLDNLKNKVTVLWLSDLIRDPAEISGVDPDWLLDYFDEVNSKIGLSLGLLQMVPSNDIPCENLENGDTSSILKIEDFNNINNIDISKAPLLMTISYFAGETGKN